MKGSRLRARMLVIAALAGLLAVAPQLLAQGPRSGQAALDQLDRQLERAAQLLAGRSEPALQGLLEQARQLRAQAATEMAQGRHAQANAHIAAARRVLDQLMARLLHSPVGQLGERLQELMRQAEQLVPGSGNMEAERLLARARQQQARAADAVRQQRYQAAAEHYRVAIYCSKRALDLVQGGGRMGAERLEEARDQYLTLLDVAEQAAARSDNPMARRSLEQARRHGLLAERARHRGDPALAWELYHQGIRILLRCISISEGEMGSPRERAEEEVQRVEELLQEAAREQELSPSPEGRLLLPKGKELLSRARRNVAAGAFPMALQNAELAEGIAYRLLHRGTTQSDALAVRAEEEISRLRLDLERARQAGGEEQEELLAQVDQLLRLAERAVELGRYRMALVWVLAGNRLLSPQIGTSSADPATEVAERLEELDQALSRLTSATSQGEEDREVVIQARALRQAAAIALQRGKPGVARHLVESAMELVARLGLQRD
ncbi:MAG: hypothetical protein H5U38_09135 [Calditrichaeota bacterium]|nr:hypothetical protein [Calditrichota bacterium]